MNFPALVLLALAMSTDAFAAAIGKGAAMQKPRLLQALRIGLLFGVIEAITPLIGWFAGSVASKWVAQWDHWIAFTLLLVLGARMIHEGCSDDDEEDAEAGAPKQSVVMLALTAVATSIDAMAVGVGLAFIDVNVLQRVRTDDRVAVAHRVGVSRGGRTDSGESNAERRSQGGESLEFHFFLLVGYSSGVLRGGEIHGVGLR